jgi:pimeloyl-ACP methyl ester carboxylesterase
MSRSRTTRPIGRLLGIVAAVTVAALALSGCSTWFLPPRTTSSPTDESVAADIAPFYHQVLNWTSCGNNMQCATAKAPLDWSNPAAGSIHLALIRQPATSGHPKGSLLVNPGGPGGSGYDFIENSVDSATSERLQSDYDIVGFDPRGVGRSSAVHCYSDPSQFDAFLFDIPKDPMGSSAWITEQEQTSKELGQDCLKYTGKLLGHIDTISSARDLDLLRAALGDKKLNYLGYSYGTLLGQTYAGLFPKRTGRMVLDGALNPKSSITEVNLQQAKGFEKNLRGFLADCPSMKGCPFGSDVDESMATVRSILDSLDASPLRNSDGRELGSISMFTAISYPLYSPQLWPYLVDLFSTVMKGKASVAFALADQYYDRDSSGHYTVNTTEAFTAVNCLDYSYNSNPAAMRANAEKLDAAAPVFGHLQAYSGVACYDWPFKPVRKEVPIAAAGSAPIIVVGTTGDPATPYIWAKAVAKQLHNGHLVTYHGDGHTAYNKSNSCVNDAVDNFLINGTVPKKNLSC